jgi:hypothetical protein
MHSCLVSLLVLQEFCSGQFWQKIFSKSFNGGVGWFILWGFGAWTMAFAMAQASFFKVFRKNPMRL